MLNWTKALKVWRSYGQGLGRLVVLVGGGLLVARLAGATTVIAHSFSTPVQEVEGIAVGTVTAIETEWDAQQGAPFTLVTFSELTVLKGEGG